MFGWRRLLGAAAVVVLGSPAKLPAQVRTPPAPAAPSGPVRRAVTMVLNSGFTGANAWLLLAEARGYFHAEGLDVQFTTGRGAYTAAGRMVAESFDFGYGDINALIEESSIRPDSAPMGVFMVFNRAPSAIILKSESPITTPKQLEGKRIIGHATDVALNTFEAFAEKARIDPKRVTIVPDSIGWTGLLAALDSGRADAAFGYLTTSMAALEAAGVNAESALRFFAYRDIAPELYGSALMASRRMVARDPGLVRAFVRAANRGLVATVNDPDAAITELLRRDTTQRAEVERNRLLRTLRGDMAGREGSAIGIGDIDPKRFTLAIKMMRAGGRMPRSPAWDAVFSRDFLPPLSERIRTLAESPQ
jgi:NitT/TauT family transport system substrate-binding protein